MNKLKTMFVSAIAAGVLLLPGVALAENVGTSPDINGGLCAGATLDATAINATDCNVDKEGAAQNVQSIVTTVINVFSWVVGVVSVIAIILGGFKYITSGGDANGVSSAKNTILYAIVGLVIVALAQVIVRFVIGTTSGLGS